MSMDRIGLLLIDDDRRTELIAEYRRRDATLYGEVLKLPWGVFFEPRPDVKLARSILQQSASSSINYRIDCMKRKIAKYALIQAANPVVKLKSFQIFLYGMLLDQEMFDLTTSLLGRPMETICFDEKNRLRRHCWHGRGDGCILAAVKRAQCCNPVILLRFTGHVKDKVKRLVQLLINPSKNHSFEDRYVGVPFDLSHVLFVEGFDIASNEQFVRVHDLITTNQKIEVVEKSLLPPILDEYGLHSRRSLFSKRVLTIIIDSSADDEFGLEMCQSHLRSVAAYLVERPEIIDPAVVVDLVKMVERKDASVF